MPKKDEVLPAREPQSLRRIRQLMLALSSKQKQDFKKSSSFYVSKDKSKDLAYVKLFDLINDLLPSHDQIPSPDKHKTQASGKSAREIASDAFYERFKKKFPKQDFVTTGGLNYQCNYLFERILETFRYQTEGGKSHFELLALEADIYFLVENDLFEEASRLIEKAKKLANDSGIFGHLFELFRLERSIALKGHGPDDAGKLLQKIRDIEKEENLAFTDLSTVVEQRNLNHESIVGLWRNKNVADDEGFGQKVARFRAIFNALNFEEKHFDAKIHWHNTLANLAVLNERVPSPELDFLPGKGRSEALKNFKAILDVFIEQESVMRDWPKRFIVNLTNYLQLALHLEKPEAEYQHYLKYLHDDPSDPVQFLRTTTYIRLAVFISNGKYKEGRDWIEKHKIGDLLHLHSSSLGASQLQSHWYIGGLFYLSGENFAEAENWFKQNEDAPTEVANQVALSASAWLLFISRFEQGQFLNYRWPDNLMGNLLARIKKINGKTDPFDHLLAKMLRETMLFDPKGEAVSQVCQHNFEQLKGLQEAHKTSRSYRSVLGWVAGRARREYLGDVMPDFL